MRTYRKSCPSAIAPVFLNLHRDDLFVKEQLNSILKLYGESRSGTGTTLQELDWTYSRDIFRRCSVPKRWNPMRTVLPGVGRNMSEPLHIGACQAPALHIGQGCVDRSGDDSDLPLKVSFNNTVSGLSIFTCDVKNFNVRYLLAAWQVVLAVSSMNLVASSDWGMNRQNCSLKSWRATVLGCWKSFDAW